MSPRWRLTISQTSQMLTSENTAEMPVSSIADGPNAGKYFIDSVVAPGQYKLRGTLPQYSSSFGQPLVLQGTVGFDEYIVHSKNTTTASTVAINGPASLGTATGVLGPFQGTTNYMNFSSG